ncbi:MAG: NAD(P)/FAD-dependent oxidoreductase, partial [Methanobacteriota archaeon]
DGGHIYKFWTFVDARQIRARAQGSKSGVAIGAGLLGIDIAVVLGLNKVKTTYLMRGDRWWREGISKVGSEIVEKALSDIGSQCVFHETPSEFLKGPDGAVRAVRTEKGNEYPADIVGVAVGIKANTDVLKFTSVKLGTNAILTDEHLQTSSPDIYAAGDITDFYDVILEARNQNGSWPNAMRQGEVAAANMVGEKVRFEHVDIYSVNHFKFFVSTIGNAGAGDDAIARKYSDTEYRRLIFKGNRLVGAVLMGSIGAQGNLGSLIREKVDCSAFKESLLEKDFDFKSLIARLKGAKG